MKTSTYILGLACSLIGCISITNASAETPVKIGILGDQSSAYSAIGGAGSVIAARMAAEDAGPVFNAPVEIVAADHQNKADVGATIARKWYQNEGVDMIADLAGSAVAISVIELAKTNHKIAITSAASSDITGKLCSAYSAQWVYDTYALGKVLGTSLTKRGDKTWFFITVDYSFGHALQQDATTFIEKSGGTIVGSVRVPFNTADFSSFLLQAQASGAKVIGFANTGTDMVTAVKQGIEFGLPQSGHVFAGMNVFLTDVKSLGLNAAKGMDVAAPFYWDLNDATRTWSKRFEDRFGSKPTYIQAGIYSAVNHYLKAVKAVGSKNADAVMAKMREMPIDDFMTTNGKLRIDGRVMRDMYAFKVKSPEESKGPWDFYKLLARVPGDEAFRPLEEGGCPLVKKN